MNSTQSIRPNAPFRYEPTLRSKKVPPRPPKRLASVLTAPKPLGAAAAGVAPSAPLPQPASLHARLCLHFPRSVARPIVSCRPCLPGRATFFPDCPKHRPRLIAPDRRGRRWRHTGLQLVPLERLAQRNLAFDDRPMPANIKWIGLRGRARHPRFPVRLEIGKDRHVDKTPGHESTGQRPAHQASRACKVLKEKAPRISQAV